MSILQRGLDLLKVGGKLAYSTCSLNPIENEAVVAAVLKENGDSIKLCDVSSSTSFILDKGLQDWQFLVQKPRADAERILEEATAESLFTCFENIDEVPEALKRGGRDAQLVQETMFSSYYPDEIRSQLSKCVRVLPHRQNTSGFFIAIIEKLRENGEIAQDPNQNNMKLPKQIQTKIKSSNIP